MENFDIQNKYNLFKEHFIKYFPGFTEIFEQNFSSNIENYQGIQEFINLVVESVLLSKEPYSLTITEWLEELHPDIKLTPQQLKYFSFLVSCIHISYCNSKPQKNRQGVYIYESVKFPILEQSFQTILKRAK
jgi:hypothetical protein